MSNEYENNYDRNSNNVNGTNNPNSVNNMNTTNNVNAGDSTQNTNNNVNSAYSLNKDQIYKNTEYVNNNTSTNTNNYNTQNNYTQGNYTQNTNTGYNNYNNPYNQNTYYQNQSKDNKLAKKERKQKKKEQRKNNVLIKGTKFVATATCFGLIAGGVAYGTNYAAGDIFGTNTTTQMSDVEKATMAVNSVNTNYQSVGVTVMDVSDIVKQAMPSIVAINGTVTESGSYYQIPGFGSFGTDTTESPVSGSGIIIGQSDTELLIVTNAHVVDEVNNLSVTFCDEEKIDAYVKGSKASKDIAVVAVKLSDMSEDTLSQIKVATIGDSDSIEVGQAAIAIGNALGYGQSVTSGCISALDRSITVDSTTYDGLIQTDAAINPGNSGGALLDASGNLIGINSAKASADSVEGMGYAIPISSVKDLINDLMNKETRDVVDEAERGYLGIYGVTVTEDVSSSYGYPQGVYVRETIENSGAKAAGIMQGDIICEVDGEDITDMTELTELLEHYKAGETIAVTVYRLSDAGYTEVTLDVTLTTKEISNTTTESSDKNNKNSNGNNEDNNINGNRPNR